MRAYPIRLKGCPRCGGDLFPEYDASDWSLSCLQCGYTRWLTADAVAAPAADEQTGALAAGVLEKEKIAA